MSLMMAAGFVLCHRLIDIISRGLYTHCIPVRIHLFIVCQFTIKVEVKSCFKMFAMFLQF